MALIPITVYQIARVYFASSPQYPDLEASGATEQEAADNLRLLQPDITTVRISNNAFPFMAMARETHPNLMSWGGTRDEAVGIMVAYIKAFEGIPVNPVIPPVIVMVEIEGATAAKGAFE